MTGHGSGGGGVEEVGLGEGEVRREEGESQQRSQRSSPHLVHPRANKRLPRRRSRCEMPNMPSAGCWKYSWSHHTVLPWATAPSASTPTAHDTAAPPATDPAWPRNTTDITKWKNISLFIDTVPGFDPTAEIIQAPDRTVENASKNESEYLGLIRRPRSSRRRIGRSKTHQKTNRTAENG